VADRAPLLAGMVARPTAPCPPSAPAGRNHRTAFVPLPPPLTKYRFLGGDQMRNAIALLRHEEYAFVKEWSDHDPQVQALLQALRNA